MENFNELFEYKEGTLIWKCDMYGNKVKGKNAGHINKSGYGIVKVFRKNYLIHRVIFYIFNGYMPEQVDHINGNTYDNRIENLRAATHKQNMQNKKGYSKSGFKGVYKNGNGYKAQIVINKNKLYLGNFSNKEDAAKAYNIAAIQHFGDFAKINTL